VAGITPQNVTRTYHGFRE